MQNKFHECAEISVISQVRSIADIADNFNTFDENIFGIYRKKVNVLFIFSVKGKFFTFSLGVSR